ncbi:MAG: NPCBM/NEW2 domain-containing protein [Planctomycetota bacterium]
MTRSTGFLAGLLPWLLGASAALASAAPQDSDPRPSRSARARILCESLDGTVVQRPSDAPPIRSLAKIGAAFVRFSGVDRTPTAEGEPVAPKDRASLELAGGDRLNGAIRGGDGDLLDVELRPGVVLKLSIDGIRSVVFPARIPASVTASPIAGEDGDRLYLVAAGSLDRAEGFVESFEPDGITFEDARLGSRTYAWGRVAALFVTPLEDEGDLPGEEGEDAGGERVSISLVGGGRISGTLVEIGTPEEGVLLALGSAIEVRLPGAIVTEVTLDDGSFRFLGDMQLSDRGTSSPFDDDLGFVWPMRVDRNCRGGLLSVGGVEYGRGLGVHAPSRLTWTIGGEWTELRVLAGVDDDAVSGTRGGTVRFRVLGDGETLWESEILRAGEPATRPAPIQVKGVSELVLEVDPAGEFVLDRANWLRPMLVR